MRYILLSTPARGKVRGVRQESREFSAGQIGQLKSRGTMDVIYSWPTKLSHRHGYSDCQ